MPQVPSALASLLPIAGAVALTVQGVRRMSRSRDAAPVRLPIQQPKEPATPTVRQRRASAPDAACADCGTAIPAFEKRCASCKRTAAGQEHSTGKTLLHWLIFVVLMTVIIGGGWALSP